MDLDHGSPSQGDAGLGVGFLGCGWGEKGGHPALNLLPAAPKGRAGPSPEPAAV